jgi:hypothetical protein
MIRALRRQQGLFSFPRGDSRTRRLTPPLQRFVWLESPDFR